MDFKAYFQRATGNPPFPYQESLASADMTRLALAAPTGAGKTAAAVVSWLWQRQRTPETTPTRLVLCEPQRTLVEQVFEEVCKWIENLGLTQTIKVHPMQGGYVDQDWELKPEQPAVIIGTQDQLLSRALNRGYAMSRFRWPIHFGLLHNDVQWVFDEIQLMGPGLETTAQLHGLRQKMGYLGQAKTLWMSATLHSDWLSTVDHPVDGEHPLRIHPFTADDKMTMAKRLNAKKPLRKLSVAFDPKCEALAKEVIRMHRPGQFTLVILNTVKRAAELHARLAKKFGDKVHLLHSRFRPHDRAKVLKAVLDDNKERIVISTQVVEAGVDISADLLISELAPRSAMIQRFGRCNRKGDQDHAEVYWVDLPEKAAAPYEWADLQASGDFLQELETVEPARFLEPLDEPRPLYDTLRRRDLLDLFDTASDLSGLDIDVSRFIRDGENRDVFLFWRDWFSEKPPLDLPAPGHHELCKVVKHEVRDLVLKGQIQLWFLDDLAGKKAEWKVARVGDLVTGHTYLLHSHQGHYSDKTGWNPSGKAPVEDLLSAENNSPFPAMAGDPRSEVKSFLTLWQHTRNVCLELEAILPSVERHLSPIILQTLRTAALWHDLGKAHPVFQETMKKHSDPTLVVPNELWAKCEKGGFHSRRYFRHELASALAARAHGLDSLTQYLIASHHGKARLSVRSFPDELDNAILGIIEGEELPAIAFPGHEGTIPPLDLALTPLSLQPFALGRGSWQDEALALRDHQEIGPFRLAFLEALLRAADVRASIEEKKGALAHV